MRKISVFMMVSVDGYFEGPNKEIDWHTVDEEFNEFASQQLDEMDGILFGRVTYQMMESYWSTSQAIHDDQIIAGKMNRLPKYVFSKTLQEVMWNNSKLIKGDTAAEVQKLKQQPGKDLVIFGSGNLVSSLTRLGLMDEFRIMIAPVVLGGGNSLFQGIQKKLSLQLLKSRTFRNGNILLTYQPIHKP
jgi:dihydrofolate reductase